MKEIKLTQGQVALVDDEDFIKLSKYSWYAYRQRNTFYAQTYYKGHGRTLLMHRLITNAPDDMQVDHINHDGLDNRRENLRIVTHRGNQQNRINKNPLGYLGVRKISKNRYEARIRINGKQISLGSCDSAEMANELYMKKVIELSELPAPFKGKEERK